MTAPRPLRGAVLVILALALALTLVGVGTGAVTATTANPPSPRMDQSTDARTGPPMEVSDPDTVPGGSWTSEGLSGLEASFDGTTVELPDGPPLSDWPVPLAPLVAGYSRFDGSCPLENETRRRIYDAIVDGPGIYPLALAETVGASRSTVRYHVRILEREGLVRTEKRRGKRRIFAAETDGCEAEPLVDDPAPGTVLTAVANHEPVSVSRVADEVDRSPSTVSYHLEQLEDGGLIERERDGKTVLNLLSDDARVRLHSGNDDAQGEPGEWVVHAD